MPRLTALLAAGLLLFFGTASLGAEWAFHTRLVLGQLTLLSFSIVAALASSPQRGSGRDGIAFRDKLLWRPLPMRDLPLIVVLPFCFAPGLALLGEWIAGLLPGYAAHREALGGLLSESSKDGIGSALLVLALLPALCEESFFRGLLLGESRRLLPGHFRPILLNGLFFGIFHLDPYRFLPLAALGCLIAAVTLLTGSLAAAILFHFLNNLLVLFAAGGDLPASGPVLLIACLLPLPGALALRTLHRRYPAIPIPGSATG